MRRTTPLPIALALSLTALLTALLTGPALAEPPDPPAEPPAEPAAEPGDTEPADADAGPADLPPDIPLYPEEAMGESTLWLDFAGFGHWLTVRSPLGFETPLVYGLGFAHQVGPARIGWHAHLFQGLPGDAPLLFLYADLLSVEYVFSDTPLRPWLRGAVGFGLDLEDSGREVPGYGDPSLGDDGYFNAENGPSGGFGLTVGGGFDWWVGDRWFLRIEALARAYGGAGPPGIQTSSHLGVGLAL